MAEINFKLNQEIGLLRLVTVGSVDDGKSTLIGRLLVDTKGAFEDQLLAVRKQKSAKTVASAAEIDLAMLTDGLQAEREQGITIDVAYRYFATPKRKFIMADCPGHEQYTRNMVTGASTADAAIILVDARSGVLTQTRRHAHILSLLRMPHVIVAVNKMDLVGYDQDVFEQIRTELVEFCSRQGVDDLICIPVSALKGDMVVERGDGNMPWYEGMTILETLETLEVSSAPVHEPGFRFPVQLVNRPQTPEWPDFRGYSGRVASGTVRVGDQIVVLPSGQSSSVREIVTFDGNLDEAFAPQSVTLTLADDIDVSRGDMIVPVESQPRNRRTFEAMVCWMGEEPLVERKKYLIKQSATSIRAMVESICYRTDVNTLEHDSNADRLEMNDIGRVALKLLKPLVFDAYEDNRSTGSFIIIDSFTNNTVGAGMICT